MEVAVCSNRVLLVDVLASPNLVDVLALMIRAMCRSHVNTSEADKVRPRRVIRALIEREASTGQDPMVAQHLPCVQNGPVVGFVASEHVKIQDCLIGCNLVVVRKELPVPDRMEGIVGEQGVYPPLLHVQVLQNVDISLSALLRERHERVLDHPLVP